MICSYDCSVPSTPYSVFDDDVSNGPDDPDDLVALTYELNDRQWSTKTIFTSNAFYPAFMEERGHSDEGLYTESLSTVIRGTVAGEAAGFDPHWPSSEWQVIIIPAKFPTDIIKRNLTSHCASDSEQSRYERESTDECSECSSDSDGEREAYVAKHQRYASPLCLLSIR